MYKTDTSRKSIQEKIKKVNDTYAHIQKYPTLALIDLARLPDNLFQASRKKIRDAGGIVFVLTKPVLERVLEKNPKLSSLKEKCTKPLALIATNMTPFELNKFFRANKKKRAAKIGENAPFEIIVPEGETDLPPGPALSELKGAGLNVQIKNGKIVVAKDSTLAKQGEALTVQKVKALQMLGIMPFHSAVNLVNAYDGHYVYSKDALDIDLTLDTDMVQSIRDALNLSINAGYPTSATVTNMLQEAYRQGLNVAINGSLYSSGSVEQLLISALRQGMAIETVGKQ